MKLGELNIIELNSLYDMTEKYLNYLSRIVKINQNQPANSEKEKYERMYQDTHYKSFMVLQEINKRINEIEI